MKWFNSTKMRLALIGFIAALISGGSGAMADYIFGEPTNLGSIVNSRFEDAGQSISVDGLTFYFSSNRSGGSGDWDLWVAHRTDVTDDWSEPENLGSFINTSYLETSPCLSADGLMLFFCDGVWHLYNPRPGGMGKCDIWMTQRQTPGDPWQVPDNLGPSINTSAHECDPSASVDCLSLFFDSDRTGGNGSQDLWFSTRASISDAWNTPTNLGSNVNSSAVDAFPSLTADGLTLFFMSDRTGDYDLWVTRRTSIDEPWGPAQNLGPAVNSSDVEACPTISFDGSVLFFMSMRPGGIGGMRDLWQVLIDPVVDLNADGIVDAADMCIIVDNWHTNNSFCDIAPMPFGDGIIDVQDLILLAEYLFEEIFPPELVAYWKLDETEGDIAYNSIGDNHGIFTGDPIWQPDFGYIAGALEFDGIDDYISTDFILDPANGAFSVLTWIKGGAPGQVIISQKDGIGSGETWLCLDQDSSCLMTGLVAPPIGRFVPKQLISESIITDNQWHHVSFVWDGAYRYLYVDGIEVAKDTTAQNSLKSATGGLYIGAGKTLVAGTLFSGLIDDVRIYNKALSGDEIAALAQ